MIKSRIKIKTLSGAAGFCPRPSALVPRPAAAFTLIEIALCLAIIGIGLVAIIGVLPWGLNAQRDNRERTIINQDATVFMQAIRDGAQGGDDLTNYVYAITNFAGTGFVFGNFTNNAQIIGLLSAPTTQGNANHAYVRSISGPAVEKPPQDNPLVTGDSFSYVLICENVPVQSAGSGNYVANLQKNLHELRLTFLWPILPSGSLPARPSRQTFRTLVAGQLVPDANNVNGSFYQPQSFNNAP